MANAMVAYFSITGTTRSVAERVARGLGRAGFTAELADMAPAPGEAPTRVQADVDLLAVGSPTHYYRLPVHVSRWLEGLPRLDGVQALPFVLYATYVGGSGSALRQLMRSRGCTETGYRAWRGAGSFLPYARRGWRFSPGRPDAAGLAAAEEWAARAARGRESAAGLDGRTHWMYALERALFWPPLVPRLYASRFSADTLVCDGCGICAQMCPMHNIAMPSGRPAWGRDCLLCLECQLRCPVSAVKSPADWRVFSPFITYNVRRAIADPGVGRARVRVEGGRIVELDG